MTSAARKPVIRLIRIAVIGAALYLLLANALLNTALLEPLVNRKPERFSMHWQRGLMLWPGRITLWDVSMTGQARRTVWRIDADRARGRIALWPLLRKQLRFVWVEAGAPLVDVHRVDTELLPPTADGRGLELVFDEVRVDSPLRFSSDDLHVVGHARAKASWRHQLRGGPFELLPSTLQLNDTVVSQGERVLLHAVTLDGGARIDAHRRSEYPGSRVLELLTVDLTVQGAAPGFAVEVDDQFGPVSTRHQGLGDLDGRIVLDHGAFGTETLLHLRLPLAVETDAGLEASGDVLITLNAQDELIGLNIDLPPVPDLVQRAELRLTMTSRTLPLPPWDTQLHRLGGEIELDSRFSSLAWLQPLLARLHGFALEGRGDVKGHIVLAEGQLAAGTEVTVSEAEFALVAYSHRFHGEARANAHIVPGSEGSPTFLAGLTLDRFDIAPASQPDAVLGSGRNLRLDLAGDGNLSQLRDRLDAHLYFSGATLPDLSRFNRYLPRHAVRFLSGTGQVGVDMRMNVAEERNDGTLSLAANRVALRLGEIVLRADLVVDAKLDAGKLEQRDFQLPGTRVAIRRAAILEPAGERVENWWASADIVAGRVRFGQPMDLAAHADVTMRDVAPLLAIFSQHKNFPRWVRRLVDAGEANVNGQLKMLDECMRLDHVEANNARFEVAARLRFCDARPSGELYMSWGVLGLGLELVRGERKFHLVGAKKWFESQTVDSSPN